MFEKLRSKVELKVLGASYIPLITTDIKAMMASGQNKLRYYPVAIKFKTNVT